MKPSFIPELLGVAAAALAAPFHAVLSMGKPLEPTLTIAFGRRITASRAAMYAAFDNRDTDMGVLPGTKVTVLSEAGSERYRFDGADGFSLEMAITERVDGHSLTIETVLFGTAADPGDFSRTLERFEIVGIGNARALNFVMVAVLRQPMGRLVRSYSYLLMTHIQKIRVDRLISIANKLNKAPIP